MGKLEDIEWIKRQEEELTLERFDEAAAFALGASVYLRASSEELPLVVDIRTWDRPLFYCAMPGTTPDNADWVRRKANTVRRFGKSTYRMVLESNEESRLLSPKFGLPPADYVLAGGGFPIRVGVAGIIGAITVSGLPERDDHEIAVAALAEFLGREKEALALRRE